MGPAPCPPHPCPCAETRDPPRRSGQRCSRHALQACALTDVRAERPARAAGQAQDRTTVSFAINEGSQAKAFDVMFALGAHARSRALVVQQCACPAPVVGR